MDPGPLDDTLLTMQSVHRSTLAWDGQDNAVLHCRRREAKLKRQGGMPVPLDERLVPLLTDAGFIGAAHLPFIQLDWHLITALVERWRPETHTFHMPTGEWTVTLQDISVLTGLRVDGRAVIGTARLEWPLLCQQLLGHTPIQKQDIDGGRLRMSWLDTHFGELPDYADALTILRHARAYILLLLGGLIVGDKSSSMVHVMYLQLLHDMEVAGQYAWGAACLAWLYRQLCLAAHADTTDIAGPLIVLQIWAWEHFTHIAPIRRHITSVTAGRPLISHWGASFDVTQLPTHVLSEYRLCFDRQLPIQVIWEPYSIIMESLPEYCRDGSEIWLARVPLICFHVVEHYYPDRVLRQFGGYQGIPGPPEDMRLLHEIDLRGRSEWDWSVEHAGWVVQWDDRRFRLVDFDHLPGATSEDYFPWYNAVTRRWIGRTAAVILCMEDFIYRVPHMSSIEDTHAAAQDLIPVLDQFRGLNINDPAPAPAQVPRQRRGGRGRGRRGDRARGQRGAVIRDEPSPPPPPPPVSHEEAGPSYVQYEEAGPSSSSYPTRQATQKRRSLSPDDMGESLTHLESHPLSFQHPDVAGREHGDDDATVTQVDPSAEHQHPDVHQATPYYRTFRRRRDRRGH